MTSELPFRRNRARSSSVPPAPAMERAPHSERFEYTRGTLEVAVDGPRVIIVSRNSGDAVVYRRNSSLRWIQQTILRSDSDLQKFSRVQMSDGMAVLGASDFGDFEENAGSAYVYTSK